MRIKPAKISRDYDQADRDALASKLPTKPQVCTFTFTKHGGGIVDAATHVVAFWDGASRGTAHTIDLAGKAKKLTATVIPWSC
jgi:hypothetical protein